MRKREFAHMTKNVQILLLIDVYDSSFVQGGRQLTTVTKVWVLRPRLPDKTRTRLKFPLSSPTLMVIRGHSMTRTRDFPVFEYVHVHGPNVRRFRFVRGRPTYDRQIAFSKHTTFLPSYCIIIKRSLHGTLTFTPIRIYIRTYMHSATRVQRKRLIFLRVFSGKMFHFAHTLYVRRARIG